MAIIDTEKKIIHCKIVYYGIGAGGKTSCFQHIKYTLGPAHAEDLLSIVGENERTLFFQCTNPKILSIQNFALQFHLYTIPGCTRYVQTKIDSLAGADGIIFVADSQKGRMQENIRHIREIEPALRQRQKSIRSFPFILQYHKRDLPNILPIDRMNYYLNPLHLPIFESDIDERSGGIMDAFDAITRMVAAQQEKTYGADR